MSGRLVGQVTVITGAGRGLGRSLARAFHREGAPVALVSRTLPDIQRLAADLDPGGRTALAVTADVRAESDVHALFARVRETFGGVDVLINNAGANQCAPFPDTTVEAWDRILDTNLRGPFLCIREILGDMLAGGSGAILNISSGFGQRALPNFTAYCASKFGLEGFTRALALELADRGVRVNTLHPGGVCDTEMGAATAPPDLPRDRWLPDDILCEPAIYLASDEGRSVTGECINAREWLQNRASRT